MSKFMNFNCYVMNGEWQIIIFQTKRHDNELIVFPSCSFEEKKYQLNIKTIRN